ncbi:hypothetical protein N9A04_00985 [Rickettsiales bacterium]|nr:hypothetical protein [Rickettsiales bacterium]
MAFTEIEDVIQVKRSKMDGSSLYVSGKYGNMIDNVTDDDINNNSAIKAIEFMHNKYSSPVGFDVLIQKNIPVAGGMGGSSSNGVAVMDFLQQYFGVESDSFKSGIVEVGGADGMFLYNGKAAICEGIGDIVTPIVTEGDAEKIPALVVFPRRGCVTKNVFKKLREKSDVDFDYNVDQVMDWKMSLLKIANESFKDFVVEAMKLGNDLTDVVVNDMPIIGGVLSFMQTSSLVLSCAMTGSGSSCFAVFNTHQEMNEFMLLASAKFPNCDMLPTHILPNIKKEEYVMNSRPSMEMIFHSPEDADDWIKIR